MSLYLRNVLILAVGVVLGGAVNMGLIVWGSSIIPAPAGVDVTNMESIAASIDQFGPRHFLFPFLAHALGTLAGALIVFSFAASQQRAFAYVVGGFFFLGGVVNAFMIPAPLWFVVLDLVGAYFPMAWLAITIGPMLRRSSSISQ